MHKVLVNLLGGLSLPRKSVVRLTDRPDMTLDVYHGRKTTMQQFILMAYSQSCDTTVQMTLSYSWVTTDWMAHSESHVLVVQMALS